ncbi:MAG: glycosyltransferase family 9 protein [Solirubrobacterales bacterium]|nr:glycosyltransferase family 9 protein [Solirubrobacterales bacterium]MBV9716644.1 glycosyltransferase family 9 protein [Solirubrobacterales bacterium]
MQPRLLVLRALGLGDLLTAVPALRALARAFAGHERILAAPTALAPLIELIDADGEPAVHRFAAAGALEPLPRELHGADTAVNLHGRGPESHRLLLATAPRRCLWFSHPAIAGSGGFPRWQADEHEVARWCRMLCELGIPTDPRELGLRAPGDGGAGRPSALARGATVIHPGAASAARRWPPERFAAVARAEAAAGRPVVITGSHAERPAALAVARAAGLGSESVLAGRTDLAELGRIVAAAGRVVCGDTGVGHLATALATPSVLLFGPTSPDEWGPPRGGGPHRVLWAGRRGDPHGERPDPGLLSISPEQVLDALAGLARPAQAATTADASEISSEIPASPASSARTSLPS